MLQTPVALRCLIVDDNPRFGAEARSLLEQEGLSVVGVAATGDDAVRLAETLSPNVALVDITLGDESGFDVARRLAGLAGGDPTAIIMISAHDEAEFSRRIDASSAIGFIPKTALSAESIRRLLLDV